MIRSLMELILAHSHSRKVWDPTQANLGKERRVFQRIALKVPCRMDNPLFGLESQGSTENMSMGGMGLLAPVHWPEGSQVTVTVGALVLNGLVVYRRDSGQAQEPARYGIKFQKLGVLDLFKLRRIVYGGKS